MIGEQLKYPSGRDNPVKVIRNGGVHCPFERGNPLEQLCGFLGIMTSYNKVLVIK